MEFSENKNPTHQNLEETTKPVLTRKWISLNTFIREEGSY